MEKVGRRDLLLLMLSGVFASLLVLSNAYADDGRAWAQEEALKEAQVDNSNNTLPVASYRQELGRTVVVEEEAFKQELDSRTRFMPGTGAKSQPGGVGLIISAAEYSYQTKAFGKIPVEFAIGSKYIGINNSTAVKLPGRLTSVDFGVQATLPFFNFNKTYFTVALAPGFYTDNWNFRSESFHLNQRYFMIYQPTEKWTFVLGAQYEPGFKPAVSPIAVNRPSSVRMKNLPLILFPLIRKFLINWIRSGRSLPRAAGLTMNIK